MTTASPIQQSQRIDIVDILRGFALVGVLFVNILCFIFKVLPENGIEAVTSWKTDRILHNIMSIFFYEKFIALFCILFGFGFGVMIQSLQKKGVNDQPVFIRRMLFLLFLSLLNFSFMLGDILHQYAFCGTILFLLRNASSKTILIVSAVLLFVLPGILQTADSYLFPNVFSDWDDFTTGFTNTVKKGNIADVIRMHWKGVKYVYYQNLFELRYACEITGKFLLGFYIVRKGFLQHLIHNKPFIKRIFFISAPLFLIQIILIYLLKIEQLKISSLPVKVIIKIVNDFTIIATTLFYVSTICLLYLKFNTLLLFRAFKYVGKMTLTNYLTQSVVYSYIFYGFGLGLLGEIHLTILTGIAIIIYSLQIVISYYWLRFFNFGPVEWLWRQVTYMKSIPLLKQKSK